jgi:quinol monooxygenase YgiN
MPSDDNDVKEALQRVSLPADDDGPGPRPMIAILDAKPGMAGQLREIVVELVRQVRREPGCLTFIAYQARDAEGRFYLYEVYASAAAFDQHLQTQHVHDFIAAVPALSTAEPGSLVHLSEIAVD